MDSSPSGTDRRTQRAPDAPGPPGGHLPTTPHVVGHAGLALWNDGGAPTHADLDHAVELGVDRVELDVCCTADGRLVMRHDVCIADGAFVADVDLAELRVLDPGMLTIDEAVEHLDARLPILLDIKTASAAEALGVWLRSRRDFHTFTVCTENLAWLLHLRFAAPGVERWPSLPDIGKRRTHHVQRVVAGLWRSHASLDGFRRSVADVHSAARQLRNGTQESLRRLGGGLPWRGHLPADLAEICGDVAASGLCVHHWVVTDDLVDEAHKLGLHVNTWTVNNPFTARVVAAAGVDSITTDRIDLVRRALGAEPRPRPRSATPAFRAAVRIVPS